METEEKRSTRDTGRRIGRSLQQLVILLLGATIVLFAVYNQIGTTVDVIFTTVSLPTSLLILVPLLIGLILGWVEGRFRRRRARRAREAREAERKAEAAGALASGAEADGEAPPRGTGDASPVRREEPGATSERRKPWQPRKPSERGRPPETPGE